MTTQPRLLDPGTADGNLGSQQQIVYDYLCANPTGVLAIDAGRYLHMKRNRPCKWCSPKRFCIDASRDANAVLDSLRGSPNDPRARRLVVRRRDGRWQLIRPVRQPDDTPIPF